MTTTQHRIWIYSYTSTVRGTMTTEKLCGLFFTPPPLKRMSESIQHFDGFLPFILFFCWLTFAFSLVPPPSLLYKHKWWTLMQTSWMIWFVGRACVTAASKSEAINFVNAHRSLFFCLLLSQRKHTHTHKNRKRAAGGKWNVVVGCFWRRPTSINM